MSPCVPAEVNNFTKSKTEGSNQKELSFREHNNHKSKSKVHFLAGKLMGQCSCSLIQSVRTGTGGGGEEGGGTTHTKVNIRERKIFVKNEI